jgi:hypothetical protein
MKAGDNFGDGGDKGAAPDSSRGIFDKGLGGCPLVPAVPELSPDSRL